jgi:lysophospholipase
VSGLDGGVLTTLSSTTGLSNFTFHAIPFPIITALDAKLWAFSFTPYGLGSWDSDVSTFTATDYPGTSMKAGMPTGSYTTNYNNLGYILGTSSNTFNVAC